MKTAAQIQEERETEKGKWLSVFPAEIWLLILDEISDADTLFNLACTSFWMTEMLHPKRTVYLFAPVLRILHSQKYFHYKKYKTRPTLRLLRCRLVSSYWKKAVDSLLQSRLYHLDEDKEHIDSIRWGSSFDDVMCDQALQATFSLYKFDIRQIKSRLLPKLDSLYYQTNSPFPSRHVNIQETKIFSTDATIIQSYRRATEQFLEKVGHHIWHVRVELRSPSASDFANCYTRIRKYVLLMPNLRSLYVDCPWSHYIEMLMKISNGRLICKFPFPQLPHLQLLNFHQLPSSAVNAMISANTQLKIVNFSHKNIKYVADSCLINKLDNLETISTSINVLKELYELPEKWKLTSIKLKFQGHDFLEWSHVFKKLEAYQNTIRDVDLEKLPLAKSRKQKELVWRQSKIMLNLPNVKRFRIKAYNFCSLDFLLGLKSVECLELNLMHEDGEPSWFDPSSEVIKLHGTKSLSKCNIWKLLSSLKIVTLETCSPG